MDSPSTFMNSPAAPTSTPKRSYASEHAPSPDTGEASENRRKDPKVSRACDACKVKKIRCSGTLPCATCARRRLTCTFASRYGRGRPPTPPASSVQQGFTPGSQHAADGAVSTTSRSLSASCSVGYTDARDGEQEAPGRRAASELVIEGQYFDLTSGLTFLHRAWSKLSAQRGNAVCYGSNDAERNQLLASAGDRPFYLERPRACNEVFPDEETAHRLFAFYFDTCVVTYRMLHRQTAEAWLTTMLRNRAHNYAVTTSVGNARAAIILTIFAIACFRKLKIENGCCSNDLDPVAFGESDALFCAAMQLTDSEMGFPRLESAQARLIQVLYLLQTSRMNKAWYTFGNAYQIISSLGLHRRQHRQPSTSFGERSDYIAHQCAKRVFWTAYTIDKYLSVVFGRPRLLHDDEIDQDFPDTVNDEEMGAHGPSTSDANEESHIISLIFHAKIAKIIGRISREVYRVGDGEGRNAQRAAAADCLVRELYAWHAELPPHLGAVKPSTLIPSFRREATALSLAYLHAVIHATRPFLLGDGHHSSDQTEVKDRVNECLSAARKTLSLVANMANDDHLFHSFWWTQYVLFCALAVVYVWEIQQNASSATRPAQEDQEARSLYELAESCRLRLLQGNLAAPSSHRYGIILEELHSEAQQQSIRSNYTRLSSTGPQNDFQPDEMAIPATELALQTGPSMLDGWQTTDWLDLDSSAFYPMFDAFHAL